MPSNNFNMFFHSQLLILKLARNQKTYKQTNKQNYKTQGYLTQLFSYDSNFPREKVYTVH